MNKILSFIFLLFFFSCEKQQPIQLPDTAPILVANCFAKAGDTWRIYLSSSAPTDEFTGQFEVIEDALVNIFDGSSEILLNHTQDGIYESNAPLAADKTYQLKVTHPNYPTLSSNLTVPTQPSAVNIKFTINEDTNSRLEFELDDVPDIDNQYFIEAKAIYITPDGWESSQLIYFNEDTPLVDFSIIDGSKSRLFFNDQIFQGGNIEFKFDTNIDNYTDIIFTIAHVDENFYRYNQSVDRQSNNTENPFAEPSPIHSNINGGLGIFAAYHSVTDTISIE